MHTSLSASERRLVMGAVMCTFFLGALDQTILAAAMPRIIADLHGLNRYGWLTTAYMLSSTVMVPIYGKIADLYGRRIVLVGGLSLFLLGSVLCGMSGEFGTVAGLDGMNQLILFRAVQGLGGAALFTTAWVIIADLYPPLERGRVMGALGAAYGAASVLGPVIGGFLTDHGGFVLGGQAVAGWRTCFYVNAPLGVVALFAILKWLPKLGGGGQGRIDLAGAGLIVATFVPLLLALTWGGHDYPWLSLPILSLFALSAASLAALIAVEARVAQPIIPLRLFDHPVIARATVLSFLTGIPFLAFAMFLPLYIQVVQGHPATQSGLTMLPMTISFIGSSILSGQLVGRTGRPKAILIGGAIFGLIGVLLVLTIRPETSALVVAACMVVVGLGMGPAQNLLNLVFQTSADRADLGAATALSQFSRQIGGTVGIALFTAVLSQSLLVELPRHSAGTGADAVLGTFDGDIAQGVLMQGPVPLARRIEAAKVAVGPAAMTQAAGIIQGLRQAFAGAIHAVFLTAAGFVLLSLLATLLIPNVILHREAKGSTRPDVLEGEAASPAE